MLFIPEIPAWEVAVRQIAQLRTRDSSCRLIHIQKFLITYIEDLKYEVIP